MIFQRLFNMQIVLYILIVTDLFMFATTFWQHSAYLRKYGINVQSKQITLAYIRDKTTFECI